MPRRREQQIEHLLRRAGFGASQAQVDAYADMGFRSAVAELVEFQEIEDDVDEFIGRPGFVGVTARGAFLPAENITDARQRWLFRMVHSRRPLQEKMALFWHNHFATAYRRSPARSAAPRRRGCMAAKPTEDPGGVTGQLELFREHALGNFRDLLVAVAKDPAMLVWLDGRTNVRARPQENFARELMELFTMGVGTFAETDVYARRARVHRLEPDAARRRRRAAIIASTTRRRSTTRPPRSSRSRSIPTAARRFRRASAAPAMQDGIDLIDAVARHPATGPRLARKLYAYFVSEVDAARRRADRRAGAGSTTQRLRNRGRWCGACCSRAQFRDPAQLLLALLVAGGVRRPRDQGSGLDRLLGERRADAAR